MIKDADGMHVPFKRLVVVGAGGWLGRTALGLARRWWGEEAASRVGAFGSVERFVNVAGGGFHQKPLRQLESEDLSDAVVLHLAFLTKDKLGQQSDRDFMIANFEIDECVESALARNRPLGVFVASSGAASRAAGEGGDHYGLMKLAQEQRFGLLSRKLDLPVFRGRIWSVAGPYINKADAYALSDFLMQADRNRRVVIRAGKPVYRTYLHTEDLIRAVVNSLASVSAPEHVVDLAGPEVLEMEDVAVEALKAVGADQSSIDRPPLDLDSRNVYVGDPIPFRDLCLAQRTRPAGFGQQVLDTLNYLRHPSAD